MKTLEQLIAEHQKFSLETFHGETAEIALLKLDGEVLELKEAVSNLPFEQTEDATVLEFADCFMCLASAAARANISIYEITQAFEKKLKINQERIWRRNSNGTYSHL